VPGARAEEPILGTKVGIVSRLLTISEVTSRLTVLVEYPYTVEFNPDEVPPARALDPVDTSGWETTLEVSGMEV
jgi:hypothetical protein